MRPGAFPLHLGDGCQSAGGAGEIGVDEAEVRATDGGPARGELNGRRPEGLDPCLGGG